MKYWSINEVLCIVPGKTARSIPFKKKFPWIPIFIYIQPKLENLILNPGSRRQIFSFRTIENVGEHRPKMITRMLLVLA